ELDQRRIAVGLRHVAEHLIVGTVLFDDVEDVLDRRTLAILQRDRIGTAAAIVALAIGGAMAVVVAVASAIVVAACLFTVGRQTAVVAPHHLGEALELVALRHVQNRDDADAIGVAAALAGRRGRRD